MISAVNYNKQSFTGLAQIKVRLDGAETNRTDVVIFAFNKFRNILLGPAKGNKFTENIVKSFSKVDPEYSRLKGMYGYPKLPGEKKVRPINYFRLILDEVKGNFIATGDEASILNRLGIAISRELRICQKDGKKMSSRLKISQLNYRDYIRGILVNRSLRLCENFDVMSRKKNGNNIEITLNLVTNTKNNKYSLKKVDILPVNSK